MGVGGAFILNFLGFLPLMLDTSLISMKGGGGGGLYNISQNMNLKSHIINQDTVTLYPT